MTYAQFRLIQLLILLRFQEIKTNIVNEAPTAFAKEISRLPAENWKDADQGCATTLVAAFDPELPGEW